MKENLMIQFVYPDYELPEDYKKTIESIDHSKIVSSLCEDNSLRGDADVIILHDWKSISFYPFEKDQCYAIRTSKDDFFDRHLLLKNVIGNVAKLNVVITDIEDFSEDDFVKYKQCLLSISEYVEKLLIEGNTPQFNLLVDRIQYSSMNNCDAGWKNVTLAPNGKFYVCPAFYYEDENDSIGDLEQGLNIKNKQLYRLDHAPICRHCDAYQCKRCIWLNRKTTLEVNTPSHEQCVVSHLERNASRELLERCLKKNMSLTRQTIKEISYLDPFDIRKDWQNVSPDE
jgi:CXXX repeat peptide maturase